jgi:hypothetical protein
MNDIESDVDDAVSADGSEREPNTRSEIKQSNEKRSQTDEIGGRKGLDPVRYGDWEKNGRCIDF